MFWLTMRVTAASTWTLTRVSTHRIYHHYTCYPIYIAFLKRNLKSKNLHFVQCVVLLADVLLLYPWISYYNALVNPSLISWFYYGAVISNDYKWYSKWRKTILLMQTIIPSNLIKNYESNAWSQVKFNILGSLPVMLRTQKQHQAKAIIILLLAQVVIRLDLSSSGSKLLLDE